MYYEYYFNSFMGDFALRKIILYCLNMKLGGVFKRAFWEYNSQYQR